MRMTLLSKENPKGFFRMLTAGRRFKGKSVIWMMSMGTDTDEENVVQFNSYFSSIITLKNKNSPQPGAKDNAAYQKTRCTYDEVPKKIYILNLF